jgi:hypothetical protein
VDARANSAADLPAPRRGSELRQRWHSVLRVLSARDSVAGVVRGRAVRLLLDDGELGQDEAAVLMGLVLSPGTAPGDAAAWIEGFVGGGSGGGMLLVHDGRLLAGRVGAEGGALARRHPEYFPSTVVQVMQADAIERLDLTRLLLEPEMLEAVEPDVHLVGTLLSLNRVMPAKTKDAARQVVRKVVERAGEADRPATRAAVSGALNRAPGSTGRGTPTSTGTDDPRQPQALPGRAPHGDPRAADRLRPPGTTAVQRDVVLCVDQSGSMAASVVFSGVFAAVLASMRSLRRRWSSSTPRSST